MARKFIGAKEFAFIRAINRELIDEVVGQEVIYFQILAEKTKANDIYNEAVVKVHAVPVRLNALIYYENTTEQVTNLAPDSKFKLDINFNTDELREKSLDPKMGDFVQFGDMYFEIYSVTRPNIVYGQVEQKILTKCTCGPARKGQFDPEKFGMPTPRIDANAPKYGPEVQVARHTPPAPVARPAGGTFDAVFDFNLE